MRTAQDYLKAIRDSGLTQSQVAERTGIPQGTISKIERRQDGNVLFNTYAALKALHDELYPAAQPEPCKGHKRSPDNHPGERSTDRKPKARG